MISYTIRKQTKIQTKRLDKPYKKNATKSHDEIQQLLLHSQESATSALLNSVDKQKNNKMNQPAAPRSRKMTLEQEQPKVLDL